MAVIPLRCYICPQEPNFSDLSHLLTHVSSKGHLAQYLKAQLRGRCEDDVRQKLDIYDKWYEQHQIEQLLSQRLSAKVSRHSIKSERKPSMKPPKGARNLKRRIKDIASPGSQRSPVKAEPTIDPQLSHSQATPEYVLDLLLHPIGLDPGNHPQMYVPHMSDWHTHTYLGSPDASHIQSNACHEDYGADSTLDNDADSVTGKGYLRTFARSPTEIAYPEAPELKPSIPMSQPLCDSKQPGRLQSFNAGALFQCEDKLEDLDDLDPTRSPLLKGIKWPGMSLFDSAGADAQRLRNQKKDRSILDRMAQNSSIVEQMEHIYWPDGTLKKRRFITGNVESSPGSQPSPPPKRPRRARTTKPRSALADLSTNGPSLPKKRGRKPKMVQSGSHASGNENVSELYLDQSTGTPVGLGQSKDLEIATERHVVGDSPSIRPHRRTLGVSKGTDDPSFQAKCNGLHQKLNPYDSDSQSRGAIDKASTVFADESVAHLDWYDKFRSYPKAPFRSENSENLPPGPKSQSQEEPAKEAPSRVTQRYFSVTGNEEPHFFNVMPPQMDFGGMAGPRYRGVTLNPLNPHIRRPRL